MTEPAPDRSGVIVPPPAIFLGFLALGLALDYLWPLPVLPGTVQYVLATALIAVSLWIAVRAFVEMRRAGTSPDVYKPTSKLVTGGPFRYSRNPIYLGLILLYAGIAAAVDAVLVLVLLLPAIAVLYYGVIVREEAYLERTFGEDYRRYKARVRRLL